MNDFKALRGDPSDNIPGVKGIGEKTAVSLLKDYGSLDNIYASLNLAPSSLVKKLEEGKDMAFLSKELSKINLEVPVSFDLEKCSWGSFDKEKLTDMLEAYGFKSLILRIPEPKLKNNLSLW